MTADTSIFPAMVSEPQHSLSLGKASASRQAYSLQYTSLILIVLTFVIGAFVRGPLVEDEELAVQLPSENSEYVGLPPVPAGLLEYQYLFDSRGALIAPERLEALAIFLQNHDINAEINVFSDNNLSLSKGEELGLVLARSVSIFRYLVSRNVPPEALRVYAVNQGSGVQAKVRLHSEGEE